MSKVWGTRSGSEKEVGSIRAQHAAMGGQCQASGANGEPVVQLLAATAAAREYRWHCLHSHAEAYPLHLCSVQPQRIMLGSHACSSHCTQA